MYEPVEAEKLLVGKVYSINLGKSHHIGKFKRMVNENSYGYAEFSDVVKKENGVRFPIGYPFAWFYRTQSFYRKLSEEEVEQKYRRAFERRAVNQIISNMIGHEGQLW